MSEILRITLVAILLAVGLACYFLVVGALFPARITKTIGAVKLSPGRSLGIGFVNFLFFGAVALALFAVSENAGNGFVKSILLVPALFITGVLVVSLSFGLLAMTGIIGDRVFPDLSAWRKTFWGTIVLAFSSLVPVLGWFLLFPYVALTGFGAVVLSYFQRNTD